jgi:DNA-binding winged helix-turn-helix (wHTH) protein/tetratricopeptide (TPR) repeat protein
MGITQPGRTSSQIDLADQPEFDVGGLRVKPSERAVEMGGRSVKLQPRVMQVLIALAQERPSVVSRDKLIEQCWNGLVVGDDALNRVILSLRHLAQEFTPNPFCIETVPRVGLRLVEAGAGATSSQDFRFRRRWWQAVLALLVVSASVALGMFKPWEGALRMPAVLVTAPLDDIGSQQLARDLAAQLGGLQAVHPASFRLLGHGADLNKAQLLLHVSRPGDLTKTGASVRLTTSPSGIVLWSKDLEHPSRDRANLVQQMAYTVAHVLRCAGEGLTSEDPLSHEILKTYLNACSAMSDAPAYDARPVARALESVILSAPRFVDGWAKLLQAETAAFASPVLLAGPDAGPALKRRILAARRVDPDLPEAHIAEFYLSRPMDFVGRAHIVNEAVERNPHHPGVRSLRALFLSSTGALNDAVREAREAIRLDPLSPALRDGLVAALAAAGDTDGALAEVAEVERLWPESTSAIEARYRLHLRYGDPREALRLIRSRAVDMPVVPVHQAFLEARLDPSPRNVDRAIRLIRSVYRERPDAIYNYALTLAQFGQTNELLDLLLKTREPDALALSTETLFRPAFGELHKDRRILQVAGRVGLLDYWLKSGEWPDYCYSANLPYDCKLEATKIGNGIAG